MYKPTSIDIEWAQATMRLLHEGAMLVFPDAQLQYKVSHLQKALVLMTVDQLNRFDSFVVHLQTISTFHAIGYEVLEYRVNIQ